MWDTSQRSPMGPRQSLSVAKKGKRGVFSEISLHANHQDFDENLTISRCRDDNEECREKRKSSAEFQEPTVPSHRGSRLTCSARSCRRDLALWICRSGSIQRVRSCGRKRTTPAGFLSTFCLTAQAGFPKI